MKRHKIAWILPAALLFLAGCSPFSSDTNKETASENVSIRLSPEYTEISAGQDADLTWITDPKDALLEDYRVVTSGGTTLVEDGKLSYSCDEPGTYTLKLVASQPKKDQEKPREITSNAVTIIVKEAENKDEDQDGEDGKDQTASQDHKEPSDNTASDASQTTEDDKSPDNSGSSSGSSEAFGTDQTAQNDSETQQTPDDDGTSIDAPDSTTPELFHEAISVDTAIANANEIIASQAPVTIVGNLPQDVVEVDGKDCVVIWNDDTTQKIVLDNGSILDIGGCRAEIVGILSKDGDVYHMEITKFKEV